MPKLYYGHVAVDNVRINYYRTGGEKPPIIMLHGFSDNALCWNRVPIYLETEYDVILPDARGHGSSGLAEDGSSPETQAIDVLRLIERLSIKQPILIGPSMSAHVAALAAAQAPQGLAVQRNCGAEYEEMVVDQLMTSRFQGLPTMLAVVTGQYESNNGIDAMGFAYEDGILKMYVFEMKWKNLPEGDRVKISQPVAVTPRRRYMSVSDFANITKKKPEKPLTSPLPGKAGRRTGERGVWSLPAIPSHWTR